MNLLQNQIIRWAEPVFSGSYKKPKYTGDRFNIARIIKDSYGIRRGQHSFTLLIISSEGENPLQEGSTCRRLGRNLYKTAVILQQPDNYEELTLEKAKRAQQARESKYHTWLSEAEFEGKFWKIEKIPNDYIQMNRDTISSFFPICSVKLNLSS